MGSTHPTPGRAELGSMVEELWYHALVFLDKYRLGHDSCNIQDLYKFVDETGILSTHQECLAQPYEDSQVDMKIMYYELIRMITAHQRDNSADEELFDSTKAVAKIEGYQELTNRLQRFLNQRFIADIEELNNKHGDAGINISVSGDVNINQKLSDLEKKFEVLATDNKILSENSAVLGSTNKVLAYEIAQLKEKMEHVEDQNKSVMKEGLNQEVNWVNSDESAYKFSVLLMNENISVQNEKVAKLDDKMEKVINQANTLLINDATHLERIAKLERQGTEFEGKLSNLESADLYLQESHRMVTERTSLVEKYSKYVEEKVNYITKQKQEAVLSKPKTEQDINVFQEKFEKRFDALQESVLDLQKERNIQKLINDIKSSNKDPALTNIENPNLTKKETKFTQKTSN